MLLDFLRPQMDLLCHPEKANNPGDLVKGRAFRRLNVTRKTVVRDVPNLIKTALNMQSFALGPRSFGQRPGSPMGSRLSPALWLMVVSISVQIWPINFNEILTNCNIFVRHLRYVDNRLILGYSQLQDLPPYQTLLDEGFYGKPISLETEPDQEFLGFMIETHPFELGYCGPTNVSQILSPFSASPPRVLLSGFRSRVPHCGERCLSHVQSPARINQIYHLAGFELEELNSISSQILSSEQKKMQFGLAPSVAA